MDGSKRGIKRKRYEPQEDLGARIEGKLHHDLKEVRKAAKKAKVFETQKLGKKLKDLRKRSDKSNDIAGAEAQLAALKREVARQAMDHEAIANTALTTKLNKDRTLSENEHVQAAILKELASNSMVPEPAGTPGSKVQSRLLSSKILAVEIAAVVEDLKKALQPKANPSEVVEGDVKRPKQQTKANQANNEHPESDKEGDDELTPEFNGEGEVGWESGTVEDSEEEQGGWESGSVDEGSGDEWNGGSDVPDDGPSLMVQPPKKTILPTKVAHAGSPSRPTGTQSTFLPSLSVGFIRGGSDDSEMSENELKAADIDIKKNRRGQRARRAIWEKKYGRNANHKKKESELRQLPANPGTDKYTSNYAPARRKEIKSIPQHQQEADSGWGQRKGRVQERHALVSRTVVPIKTHREEKPIHPSWEAKRKLKEKESAGIVPSQGKKIKFS